MSDFDYIDYLAPDYSASPPNLYATSLPPLEQNACDLLNGYLSELTSFVSDFGAALELYEFSTKGAGYMPSPSHTFDNPLELRKRHLMRRWRFISAKDGAMTLYHFGEVLDAIRGGFGDCGSLRQLTDTEKLKEADKQFDREFPNYVKLRHSVAHQSIVAKAPFAALVNSDGGGRVIITGSLSGRRFISTWNGIRVAYELSEQSLSGLAAIRDQVFEAFAQASVALSASRAQK